MPNPTYETKNLRYKICEFLIEKKREQDTIGRPLIIGLKELEDLLQYAVSTKVVGAKKGDRILDLAAELGKLNNERFGDNLEKSPLQIVNVEILEGDFVSNFEENEDIEIKCLTKNLEEYMYLLREATGRAKQAENQIRASDLPNGGVLIIVADKSMKIGGGRGEAIRANIVRLMLGEGVRPPNRRKNISIPSYQKGDIVAFSDLVDLLEDIGDNASNLDITDRTIRDAVRGINERAEEPKNFGKFIFKISENESSFRLI